MKILIVEDEPINRKLVKQSLLTAGYEVVEANDGLSAWELFQQEPFQLIITDWMMPGLNGQELVHRIRTSKQKSYTYIIMLTAMDNEDNVVLGLESGADEYLTKPINSRELVARVASGVRILKLEEQLMQAHQQMETLAMYDGLTNLLNRRALEEFGKGELNKAIRKELPFCIILIDIDYFKSVNDQHGHKIGDIVLQAVAKILSEEIRDYDRIGRWGGEEFISIMPETHIHDAIIVAERMRTRIADTKILIENGASISIHISLGVACSNKQKISLSTLIDSADQALYQAKQNGRNQVCVFNQPP
ncbi:MAG: diguanylate cyclase [Anaerolineales bacterium]|nr:diguanylate cyclase [Anaerolineales bacterium]